MNVGTLKYMLNGCDDKMDIVIYVAAEISRENDARRTINIDDVYVDKSHIEIWAKSFVDRRY